MPKITDKESDDLLAESRRLASQYVPEWRPASDGDPGVALLKIFTHMREDLFRRLNRVPEKSFGAFLDMLGLRLMPAQPAKVPVTFFLSKGLKDEVFVPARTRITAPKTEKHSTLIFETIKNLTASKAQIEEAYSIDPDNDAIYCHTSELQDGKEFRPFEGSNLQRHVLYLGHADLFKVNEFSKIKLQFIFADEVDPAVIESWVWKYWDGSKEMEMVRSISWPDPINHYGKCIIVLVPGGEIKEREVNHKTSIWIECDVASARIGANLPVITEIRVKSISVEEGRPANPDQCFYNDLPLDLSRKIFPLGRQPKIFDTFYISSKEAFSKRGGDITVTFDPGEDLEEITEQDMELSWEYWNGALWKTLALENSEEFDKYFKNSLIFRCPNDLQETVVGGVKGLWIRVRLISGNYGSFNLDYKGGYVWDLISNFKPPSLDSIKIIYGSTADALLQHCVSYNNLEYRDVSRVSRDTGFKPFLPIEDSNKTLYLGFGSPLKGASTSIFFSLFDEETLDNQRPKVRWSYWSRAQNIDYVSETEDGMGNDISELVLVDGEGLLTNMDLMLRESFDSEEAIDLASISFLEGRAVYLDKKLDHEFTEMAEVFKRVSFDTQDSTDSMTRTGILELMRPYNHQKTPRFGRESYWAMGSFDPYHQSAIKVAMVRGLYPNTVWAEQVETIKEELLGSSDGEKGQTYRCIRRPVLSPEVWVREGIVLPKEDKEVLQSEGFGLQEVKDRDGKAIDTWIRWKAAEDLLGSGERSRRYILDGAAGEVSFGDGIHGMIPPAGRNNVKISYKSGGGLWGNIASGEISALKSSVSGIARVTNPRPAEDGSDAEALNALYQRGPRLLRSLGRAVTREDFELMAKASSSFIARAKCFVDGSRLKVIIIPNGEDDKPAPSSGLKSYVKEYLLERSMSTVKDHNLEIIAPIYREVRVRVDLFPESMDMAGPLEKEVRDRLRRFLHPLTGGFNGAGWEFGRSVHISDVYALLEGIQGVDHLENLLLNDLSGDIEAKEYEMICSGEHEIRLSFGGGR